jgi:bifunctional DNase/RNase
MTVLSVMPEPAGGWVLSLTDAQRRTQLPILVGDAEGAIIQRRLAGRPFERPLTHDLLDHMIRRLGGRVVQVEIGELRTNVFIGKIVVQDGAETFAVDARSSDAVAVALGNQAPIFVSDAVIARAGVPLL